MAESAVPAHRNLKLVVTKGLTHPWGMAFLPDGAILIAFTQSFIWAMGTYATPSALGPDTLWTVGYLVQEQMLGKHNWPMAAALSMILVTGVAGVMILTRSLMSKRTAFHA